MKIKPTTQTSKAVGRTYDPKARAIVESIDGNSATVAASLRRIATHFNRLARDVDAGRMKFNGGAGIFASANGCCFCEFEFALSSADRS